MGVREFSYQVDCPSGTSLMLRGEELLTWDGKVYVTAFDDVFQSFCGICVDCCDVRLGAKRPKLMARPLGSWDLQKILSRSSFRPAF